MATYALYADVKARAGRVAAAFEQAGKHPDQTDVELLIANLSSDVDEALLNRGFDPATLTEDQAESLTDMVAYGALARALVGLPSAPAELLAEARSVWELGLAGITDGTNSLFRDLGALATATHAGSFWEDEPEYGMGVTTNAPARQGLNPDMAPAIARVQKL